MTTIAVAGATGNLGGRIVRELRKRGADVRALVRPGTAADRLKPLEQHGATIAPVDLANGAKLEATLKGTTTVVSALQGLREVIVDTQSQLLEAAEAAGAHRFIPSDYSIDFAPIPRGQNRNLDLRREFQERVDRASIKATSILNGAFMELLIGRMQLLDLQSKRVTYFGNPDQKLEFTTLDDAAAFTAAAALDENAPRWLRVAGDSISPRELAEVAGELTKSTFQLVSFGSTDQLAERIKTERAANPESEREEFPRWQGMQYMLGMFSGAGHLKPIENQRYPDVRVTTVRDLLKAHLAARR